MFVSRRLLQACRITLFTRENCGLCTQAKGVLSTVWDTRPFVYGEVNLAESKSWRELYDFDIPVVSCRLDYTPTAVSVMLTSAQIHISRAEAKEENVSKAGKAVKLMHRFTPEQVEAKMDQVEES